jgi:hypothetical protein
MNKGYYLKENKIKKQKIFVWDNYHKIYNDDIENFKNACKLKKKDTFGKYKCVNRIFCVYKSINDFVVPLGILNEINLISNTMLSTKKIYKLTFGDKKLNILGLDSFEIKISEENIRSRIRFKYLRKPRDDSSRSNNVRSKSDNKYPGSEGSRLGTSFNNMHTAVKDFIGNNFYNSNNNSKGKGGKKTLSKKKNKKQTRRKNK